MCQLFFGKQLVCALCAADFIMAQAFLKELLDTLCDPHKPAFEYNSFCCAEITVPVSGPDPCPLPALSAPDTHFEPRDFNASKHEKEVLCNFRRQCVYCQGRKNKRARCAE